MRPDILNRSSPGLSAYRTSAQESIRLFHCPGFSGLHDLGNFVTLAQSPAVAPLLTRYRLLSLQFKFLSTKDDV
jgi:hypothetical protein